MEVTAELSSVPEGRHGFHIHEKGDCGDNGNAAGGMRNDADIGNADNCAEQ